MAREIQAQIMQTCRERERERERGDAKEGSRSQADLEAALVEALDGEHDAGAGGGAEEGAVDGAEAALAELERAAEAVGGAAELVEVEHPEPLRAPLLRQLLDGPRGRGRRRRLGLAVHAAGGGVGRRGRLGQQRPEEESDGAGQGRRAPVSSVAAQAGWRWQAVEAGAVLSRGEPAAEASPCGSGDRGNER